MPTTWRACRLDDIGFVGRGRSRHRPRNDQTLYGGAYPFFQTGDIKAASFYATEYSQTYNEVGLAQSKLWPPGTLCITIAANIAETAILGVPGCFPDSIVGFLPDQERADVRFVKYYIDTLRLGMQSASHGTTQDNLSLDKLLSFELRLPPLPVQQQIANLLHAYEELIENNGRRIRLLEGMARALYQKWFGDALGASKFPLASVTASKYWTFVAENVRPYEGSKRYLATADLDGIAAIGEGIEYVYRDLPSRAQKQPVVDSVWFARMRDTYKIAWFSEANKAQADAWILSSGFAGFRATAPEHWPYLFLTISSPGFHAQKDRFCTGATQASLTNEGLSRIEVPAPPQQIVRRFGAIVLPFLSQILVLQQAAASLRRTRDLLIPRLLSGQLRVDQETD